MLDKQSFDDRKRTLLEEQQSLQESLQAAAPEPEEAKRLIMEQLELACTAQQSYRLGSPAARRELVIQLCSNLTVAGKDISVEPSFPFHILEDRYPVSQCGHHQDATRTMKKAVQELWEWAKQQVVKQDRVDAAA